MKILVINAGSSSLKYQLMSTEDGTVFAKGLVERIGLETGVINHTKTGMPKQVKELPIPNHQVAIEEMVACLLDKEVGVVKSMQEIEAVGHRVVHGGETFTRSVFITPEVKEAIAKVIPLAPLHNPANLIGIEACEKAMPGVPMVAVFDTAFHQTMPAAAYMYPLPYEYYEKYGVRRYGFHGTSHSYVSKRASEILGKNYEDLKMVICHLGNGASLSAVAHGKCIDTSMGMTPLAGVPMGTRCGDIDPAILKFLLEQDKSLDLKALDNILNKKSGVLGLSGISSDFRDVGTAAEEGNARAQLALDVYAYQVKKNIGAYAAAMGGLDVIVFTAGVGENGPLEREMIVDGLEFLGFALDKEKNQVRGKEIVISTEDSKVKLLVVPTNEELKIAQETEEVLKQR